MSIRVMTAVWDYAAVSGGDLLVLLAMADHAHDDGSGVYPLQATLAAKARMSERNLRYCLESLEERGYIERQGKRGTRICWRIDPDPANIATRQPTSGQSGNGLPTEPLGNRPVEDSLRSSSTSSAEKIEKLRATNGVVALCDRLAELMRERDPKIKVDPVSLRWLDAAEKLMRIEERHFEEAMKVLEFSQRDPFWQTVILSMPTFRAKYPALRAKWINTLQRNGFAPQKPQATVAELMEAQERFHADQRERLARRGITPDSTSSRRETNARPTQGTKS